MYSKQQDTISLHYSQAKKILVMNQKGGVGKSTCAAALISHLIHLGYNVEVIDFDRQRSCHDWAKEVLPGRSLPYNPSLRSLSNIATTLKVKRDTDFVVIDSGILSSRKVALAFVLNRCFVYDDRVERTHQLLQHFRQYPTLGKISEDTQYQEAFFYKQAIPATVDPQLWRQVIGWLQKQ
ncbi:ParA family protein [Vibrio sp. K4]|uniref:ParA family protein n=1 Tax=Vibrio sp. K4 TaxID=3391579 RepID=UPI003DA795F3